VTASIVAAFLAVAGVFLLVLWHSIRWGRERRAALAAYSGRLKGRLARAAEDAEYRLLRLRADAPYDRDWIPAERLSIQVRNEPTVLVALPQPAPLTGLDLSPGARPLYEQAAALARQQWPGGVR